jgi:TctA family transporter
MAVHSILYSCNSAVILFCYHHHQYHHLQNFHYHCLWIGFEIFRVVKKLWLFGLLHRVVLYSTWTVGLLPPSSTGINTEETGFPGRPVNLPLVRVWCYKSSRSITG